MKKIVFAALAVFIAFPAAAEIRRADADRKVMVSEGSLLMTQVDIVSLYLTSEKVAYEPRMDTDKISVQVTVLSRRLIENREKMQDFVTRQIEIFKRELSMRVAHVAPSIADHFDPNSDIIFEINAGTRRERVAYVNGGNWTWVEGRAPETKTAATAPYYEDSDDASTSKDTRKQANASSSELACDSCPALIRKK